MTLPDGYTTRPATPGDLDAVVGLLDACNLSDIGEVDPVRLDVEETWRLSGVDLQRDTRLVLAPEHGEVAAYAEVIGLHPDHYQNASARVHPEHRVRGIGGWLLDVIETNASARLSAGARSYLRPSTIASDAPAAMLMAEHGFDHVRRFWNMDRALDPAERFPDPPSEVSLRPLDEARDMPLLHRTLEAAFAEHWGFEPLSFDEFDDLWRSADSWDPTLVAFAELDGETAGVVTSLLIDDHMGWVGDVGVLPACRGRGIGSALLHLAFGDLRDRGVRRVRLNVDAANQTGATRLYQRVGMTPIREWSVFEKVIEESRV